MGPLSGEMSAGVRPGEKPVYSVVLRSTLETETKESYSALFAKQAGVG